MDINLIDINKANKRVEAALNRRYERNAELFISKQDVEDIRKWLYEGQLSYVFSKFKAETIHPDIYFLTILKNSWLIDSLDRNQFKEFIRPILIKVRPNFAKSYLKEVAERKMDVPEIMREELLKYYVQTLTVEETKAILLSGETLGVVRLRLLVGKLLEEHIGTDQFISKHEALVTQYPAIKGDIFFLKSLPIPEALQRKHIQLLVNWINKQAEQNQVQQYFINGLYINYELLYVIAIEQAKQNVGHIEKRKIWFKQIAEAANKLIKPKTHDVTRKQVTKEIIQLYDYFLQYAFKESPYYIRYCLKQVHNDYFREQLNMYFNEERIKQVPLSYQTDLKDALSGNDSGIIKTVDELVIRIKKYSGRIRDMNYFAHQFVQMRPSSQDWLYLFKHISYTSNIMKLFISIVLKISKDNAQIWQSYFHSVKACQVTESYAISVITEVAPRNKEAKQYLEQKDYKKYSEIYRV
jgi:hypothetical protein